MKSARVLNILSLIINVIILSIVVFINLLPSGKEMMNSYHLMNVLSSALLCGTALLCIPFNIVGIVKRNRLPIVVYVFKLIGTTTALASMAFAIGALGYLNGFNIPEIFGGFAFNSPTFYLNLVVPALAFVGFAFFDHTEEAKFPITLLTTIPAILYSVVYIYNVNKQFMEFDGAYDFYGITNINKIAIYIVFIGLVVASFILASILYLINRGLGKLFFKEETTTYTNPYYDENDYVHDDEEEEVDDDNEDIEEPAPIRTQVNDFDDSDKSEEIVVDDEDDASQELEDEEVEEDDALLEIEEEEEEEIEVEEEEVATKDDTPNPVEPKSTKKTTKKSTTTKKTTKKPASTKDTATSANTTKVYHLTKRKEDGMWAITFVGGKKPVKLFKTKKEAEEYLAILTKNQGATALIRNSKGAKAGKFASSIKHEDDNNKK